MTPPKPKVAMYWCAACGGCDEALLDVDDLPELLDSIELTLWPAALDFKYDDLRALDDGELAIAMISGAIRSDEQEALAKLLRRKAQTLVAFGACAAWGGVPALANLSSKEAIFRRSYLSSPSVDNPEGILPQESSTVDGHALTLPAFHDSVRCLADVVTVDYVIPGCPPGPQTISAALGSILGGTAPERGSVLAADRALCASCERNESKPQDLRLDGLRRVIDADLDDRTCFLAQGVVCMGPATRDGCGQACIQGNMPCTGCYGPVEAQLEQGAKMIAALGGLLQGDEARAAATEGLVDPAGTLYRYTLSTSLLGSAREEEPR